MSHVVKIETQIRDINAVRQACVCLKLEPPVHNTFELYNSSVTGWGVYLRDWKYPIVCKTDTGEIAYDNFGGRWGNAQRLDEFRQRYVIEKTKIESRRQGHTSTEKLLEDGSVRVTINTGGDA